jgi:hypothetical protein
MVALLLLCRGCRVGIPILVLLLMLLLLLFEVPLPVKDDREGQG